MALYHKWDVKNDFAYVLQFFSLISDSLGSVHEVMRWYQFGLILYGIDIIVSLDILFSWKHKFTFINQNSFHSLLVPTWSIYKKIYLL